MSLEGRVVGLVEDDPIMGESLVQRLALEGTIVRWWKTGQEAISELERARPEAIICDIRLPDMNGEDVFRQLASMPETPPFLFITAFSDVDHAVSLMRAGAGDYLTKPFEMPDFLARLSELLPTGLAQAGPAALGFSDAMREVAYVLTRVARSKSPVLLTGETGVGKEVAAHYLHELGGGSRPFMAVNCAAIPAELMEAELFGHERGAFTGALAKHAGYAERAGEGTLFLDEVGELSMALQSKLLRLLEERRFFRVGGERALAVNARVICATNADLQRRVSHGTFREDLYYRINVISVPIPPLRERLADIPQLLEQYFDLFNEQAEPSLRGMSAMVEEVALAHPWPGNVRELKNRMERAVAMATGPMLMPSDVFPELSRELSSINLPDVPSLEQAREDAERRHIARILKLTGNEMAQTARLLGISRTTLWEKMRRLGLSPSTH